MALLEQCKKYFNTDNLYIVLNIPENASDKDVKKAYHKLSLKVHPDRVDEDDKLEATEKFKVLGGVHAVLSDKEKRAIYDETKTVADDDNDSFDGRDWSAYWRFLFKKITEEDIINYEKEYIGSQQERDDIKKAYLGKNGDMDYIIDNVQFANSNQEPRIREIINDLIEQKEVPSYKKFTHEPAKKIKQRKAKENKEAKEAEEFKKELGLNSDENSLELMIKQRQESRANQFESLIDNLAAKYSNTSNSKSNKRKVAAKTETVSKK